MVELVSSSMWQSLHQVQLDFLEKLNYAIEIETFAIFRFFIVSVLRDGLLTELVDSET